MSIRLPTLALAALAAAIVTLAVPAQAADAAFEAAAAAGRTLKYRITDLGPGVAADINRSGQVLITGITPNRLWSPDGSTVDFNIGGYIGYSVNVSRINDRGQATGTGTTADFVTHALRWRSPGSAPTALQANDGRNSTAFDINNGGVMVGHLMRSDGQGTLGRWAANGTLTDLYGSAPSTGCFPLLGSAINDNNVIAATVCGHASRIDAAGGPAEALRGLIADVEIPYYCSDCTFAYGIGVDNTVIGIGPTLCTAADGSTQYQAYRPTLWAPGAGPVDLGEVSPCAGGAPFSINRSGVVVGARGNPYVGQFDTAWRWTAKGGMVDLNSLVDPTDPLLGQVQLAYAIAVSDRGVIVGAMSSLGCCGFAGTHAFMLTPVR